MVEADLDQKSRIRETKHLLTNVDSSTDTTVGWTKNTQKPNLRGDFRPLANKNVQTLDHFFPLLFPKDSESLKILDIRLREVGAKRPLNGTSKVNRQTDTHTHRYMDKSTYRKHRLKGPMLWKKYGCWPYDQYLHQWERRCSILHPPPGFLLLISCKSCVYIVAAVWTLQQLCVYCRSCLYIVQSVCTLYSLYVHWSSCVYIVQAVCTM